MLRTGPELKYLADRVLERRQHQSEREKSILKVIVNALGKELIG